MHSHGNDVLMMDVGELLCVSVLVVDDTDTGSCENDLTVGVVSQVSTRVETSESMSPLKSQCVLRSFAHCSGHLEAIGDRGLYLTTPDVHTTSLVTFVKLDFTKAILVSIITEAFFVCAVFLEVVLLPIIVGKSLRLLSCFLIHEVLPLEDAFVFATGGDQELLPSRVL
jgi:hypothetical protein